MTVERIATTPAFTLSEQQVAFFSTFGFLKLPGLYLPEIETIEAGFEEVFAEHDAFVYSHALHYGRDRATIAPGFIDRSEKLSWLRHDERLLGIVHALIGDEYLYVESDGNIFSGDTSWHCDIFGAPLDQLRIKCYFYLDPLTADTGAVRYLPGTQHWRDPYARNLRRDLETPGTSLDRFGMTEEDLPGVVVPTQPGDLVVAYYRTLHATFGGGARRRLFTVNFGAPAPAPAAG